MKDQTFSPYRLERYTTIEEELGLTFPKDQLRKTPQTKEGGRQEKGPRIPDEHASWGKVPSRAWLRWQSHEASSDFKKVHGLSLER